MTVYPYLDNLDYDNLSNTDNWRKELLHVMINDKSPSV